MSDLSDRQEREAVQLVDLKRSFDMHTAVQTAVKQDVQSINKGVRSHFPSRFRFIFMGGIGGYPKQP